MSPDEHIALTALVEEAELPGRWAPVRSPGAIPAYGPFRPTAMSSLTRDRIERRGWLDRLTNWVAIFSDVEAARRCFAHDKDDESVAALVEQMRNNRHMRRGASDATVTFIDSAPAEFGDQSHRLVAETAFEKRSRRSVVTTEQVDIRVGRAVSTLAFWAGRDDELPLDETFPLDALVEAVTLRLTAATTT